MSTVASRLMVQMSGLLTAALIGMSVVLAPASVAAADGVPSGATGVPIQGDPVTGTCWGLEVRSLKGPTSLGPGGSGTVVAIIDNPNARGTCDDGATVRLTFNGSPEAVSSADGGPNFVCSPGDPAPFAYAHRCDALSFGGMSSATLTFAVTIPEGIDRIALGVRALSDDADKSRRRPGKVGYTDLNLKLTVPTNASAPGPATKPQNAPQPTGSLPTLRVGANGERTTALQHLLVHHGHDVVVDGDFGEQTQEAVRAFQTAKGLTVDGVVGPQTWSALLVTVKRADQGDAVSAAQTLLKRHGHEMPVDGDFGDVTHEAVRAFQGQKGLTVDGVVGPQTWGALLAPA